MTTLVDAVSRRARDAGRQIIDSDYRHRRRELARLSRLPRYSPSTTDLLGKSIELVDGHSFAAMYNEIFEQNFYRFKCNNPRPFIIDGGANIGLSVLYFKQLFPESRIIAFEPDPQIFQVLRRNVCESGYDNVQLHSCALWSNSGSGSFVREGSWGGRLSLSGESGHTSVPFVRLRDYLDSPVAMLKLDIEGAETEVLRDCAALLYKVSNLFVEYHSFFEVPQTLHILLGLLSEAGFRVQVKGGSGTPEPFVARNLESEMEFQVCIWAYRE
ncbi:MAG TPA: FkbM family methyltransferase [Terriglobales bacterium]|nr:FkbM family methyltransferase [Terriglobales bacterium]